MSNWTTHRRDGTPGLLNDWKRFGFVVMVRHTTPVTKQDTEKAAKHDAGHDIDGMVTVVQQSGDANAHGEAEIQKSS